MTANVVGSLPVLTWTWRATRIQTTGTPLLAVKQHSLLCMPLPAQDGRSARGSLVFTTKWGEPLYPDTVTALMNKLINAHNKAVTAPSQVLPHAQLHDLRHLHATTLLLAGVPVHVVAARLGHADPAVTLRVYSHVLREHALGVGDTFAQAVRTPVSKSVSKPGNEG